MWLKYFKKINFIFLIIFILSSSLFAENNQTKEFVERVYENFLNRQGDLEGLEYWSNLLENNKSAAYIAKNFFESKEFQSLNISNEDFVTRLYKTFLNRKPDTEGLKYWSGMLDEKRVRREQIFYSFAFSREFTLTSMKYKITPYDKKEKLYAFIERFYNLILDRKPSTEEIDYWYENIVNDTLTPKEVAGGFLYSKEFLNKNTDNETFVRILYQAVMNRSAEEEGLRFWTEKLDSKELSREKVIEFFLNSKEFKELYAKYLQFDNLLTDKKNLNLKVSPFSIKDNEGDIFKFNGGEIELFPNEDQYIFVDIFTKEIHRFKHYYHDGGILLGFVKTSQNSIQKIIPIDIDFPKNAISKFTKKLFSNTSVKIAIIGDSLFRPDTGEGNRWLDRVFNKNNENKTFLFPFAQNIKTDNFSVGGESAMWGLAQLAWDVKTDGYIEDGEVYATKEMGKEDPVLTDNYDLYIIGLGTNDGSYNSIEHKYNKEFYEAMIRKLIKNNKDVMIVTASNNKNIINYHTDTVDWQIEIARKYGCALANSWDYTYEAAKEGKNIWTEDTIHMNDEGQKLYANAVRSVIFPYQSEIRPKSLERVYIKDDFPNDMEIIFKTSILDGARYVEYNLTDGAENLYPPKRHGYNEVCEIRENQSATFLHPFAKGAALLVQAREPFRAKIFDEKDNLIREIELKKDQVSFHTIPLLVPLDMKEEYNSYAWRIEVEKGVFRVYGLVALTKD